MRDVACKACGLIFQTSAPRVKFCGEACRFWSSVDQRGEDECWPWKRSKPKGTYGQYCSYDIATKKRSSNKTHRIAYRLACGPIADKSHVLHTCDNPACCNPKHLFLGDQAINMDDKARKLRAGKVIDALTARSIRMSEGPSRTVAAEYGVSPSLVKQIRAGTIWRYA